MKALLKKIYAMLQALVGTMGYHFVVSRKSARNMPELVNRAIWKPFATPDEWRELYLSTQKITKGDATDNIFRQCRFYSTFQLADYAASLPEGDVIECGCWHGHSTVAISRLLAKHGFRGRFHVFDSFEGGLSGFTDKDDSAFGLSASEKETLIRTFQSSEEFVRSVTSQFGFVELHKGWIPQSFAGFQVPSLRFVHIDVDMYEPTKAALDLFWPRMVRGGCIVVDDYNHLVFEGATRAVDEFLKDKQPAMFYRVPFGSCFIIK